MFGAQVGERTGDDADRDGLHGAEPDHPGRHATHPLGHRPSLLDLAQHPLGMAGQHVPGLGEAQRAADPLGQRDTDRPLQGGKLVARRRATHVHRLGCGRQRAALPQFVQQTQSGKRQHC